MQTSIWSEFYVNSSNSIRRDRSGHARQRGLCLWHREIWWLSVRSEGPLGWAQHGQNSSLSQTVAEGHLSWKQLRPTRNILSRFVSPHLKQFITHLHLLSQVPAALMTGFLGTPGRNEKEKCFPYYSFKMREKDRKEKRGRERSRFSLLQCKKCCDSVVLKEVSMCLNRNLLSLLPQNNYRFGLRSCLRNTSTSVEMR